jgi:phosphatidylserine/phosphatidylglycerophosphate/cardiolipin synthase-like enzyme
VTAPGAEWFSTALEKGLSPVFKDSDIEAFVDAEEYYADLRSEVEATTAGDLICWIGFDGGGATPMPLSPAVEPEKKFPPRDELIGSDVKWLDLLKSASNIRSVSIRVLLNLHPSPRPLNRYKGSNFDLVAQLNALNNCTAINDFRYLYLNGTHHQKLVLVYNAKKGLMAYVGTCDVETVRIRDKWGEVQCKVVGDAAAELFRVFQRRWSEHTEVFRNLGSIKPYLKPLSQMKTTAPRSGNFLIQVATTYGNPARSNPLYPLLISATPRFQHVNYPHRLELNTDNPGIFFTPFLSPMSLFKFGNDFFTEVDPAATPLIDEASKQSKTYGFAPKGNIGIYCMIEKAIERAEQFIYVEDQYLICDMPMGSQKSVMNLLIDKLKLPTFKKLIVFCTRIDDINDDLQFTARKHRDNFVLSLIAAGGDKVEVCQYKSKGSVGCPGSTWTSIFYTHSKTWIFDDVFLITGSANCNRRGYSHDSELDIGVYDQNQTFVKDLRVRIWRRRLNAEGMRRSPIQPQELSDFLGAAKFWEDPGRNGLPLDNSKTSNLSPRKYPDLDLASYKAQVTAEPGFGPQIISFIDKLKMDGIWDFVVDPEGT